MASPCCGSRWNGLARKLRFEPKDFRMQVPEGEDWRLAGNGEGNPHVLYRLPAVMNPR